jgi:hypothetical protein
VQCCLRIAPSRKAGLLCRQTHYCVWLNRNRFVTFRYLMFLCLKARKKQEHGVLLLITVPPIKYYVSFPLAGRPFAVRPCTGTKPSLGQERPCLHFCELSRGTDKVTRTEWCQVCNCCVSGLIQRPRVTGVYMFCGAGLVRNEGKTKLQRR